MSTAQSTDPAVKYPELQAAIDAGYAHLLAQAMILIHKRRPWLKESRKLQLAEEIVQEALSRAWQAGSKYDRSRRPMAWLMGFIINVVQEALRGDGSRKVVRATDLGEVDWEQILTTLRVPDGSLVDEYRSIVSQARQELSEPQKRILALHFDQQLEGQELARQMGLPSAGAARVAKHRALEALREHFFKLLNDGEEKKR